jgi:hypothetical protein
VRLEFGPGIGDHASPRQAEDLEAAAIGQQRSRPADEAVQTAAPRDHLVTGSEEQVVGVAQNDLGAERFEIAMQHGLDAALRTDRHERRRLHHAMRCMELAAAGRPIGAVQNELKCVRHRIVGPRSQVHSASSRPILVPCPNFASA